MRLIAIATLSGICLYAQNVSPGGGAGSVGCSSAGSAGTIQVSDGAGGCAAAFAAPSVAVGTGARNTAFGSNALGQNTTGSDNLAIGLNALGGNTTGIQNISLGLQSLIANTSGNNNIAIGDATLQKIVLGSDNIAIGEGAGTNNVLGTDNLFLGHNAGHNELGSAKLYIDDTATATPLIGGDFTARTLALSAAVSASSILTSGFLATCSACPVFFNGSTIIEPTADGNLKLSNFARTSFGLLQFGGTTSSFPALKLSGTGLVSRLSDDSADTSFQASKVTANYLVSNGTAPTITGCGTISARHGGVTGGDFTTDTTGTCAAAFALPTAPTGWVCNVTDITKHVATNIMMQSATSTTGCTVTGTTAASDVLTFTATAY